MKKGAAVSTAKVVACKTYTCLHRATQAGRSNVDASNNTRIYMTLLPSSLPSEWLGQTVDASHVHDGA
jgi:hypothetical protein